MDSVRRTIGAADPLTYVVPWSYTSPDFSEVSRFGEQFIHSSYIGWVLLATCVWHFRIALRHWVLGSHGGVLVVIKSGIGHEVRTSTHCWTGNTIALHILESLPLFDHLTLLYRLSWIPVVCVIGFSVHHWTFRPQLLCVLTIVETILVSPVTIFTELYGCILRSGGARATRRSRWCGRILSAIGWTTLYDQSDMAR